MCWNRLLTRCNCCINYKQTHKFTRHLSASFSNSMQLLALSLVSGTVVVNTESGRILTRLESPGVNRPCLLEFDEQSGFIFGLFRAPSSQVLRWSFSTGLIADTLHFPKLGSTGETSLSHFISDFGAGPIASFDQRSRILVHSLPGEFASGQYIPGSTSIIVRRFE